MMRDRLIKLLKSPHKAEQLRQMGVNIKQYEDDCVEAMIADFLLTNGVIVPPCKVGDTVYLNFIDENANPYIDKGRVYAVSKCEDTVWFSVRYLSGLRYDHTSNDFGKTVFLSREEAEAALKGADDEQRKAD